MFVNKAIISVQYEYMPRIVFDDPILVDFHSCIGQDMSEQFNSKALGRK